MHICIAIKACLCIIYYDWENINMLSQNQPIEVNGNN